MSNKAIFLDCDNTLIEDPGYINNPDQVRLLEGVAEALIELKAMGYKLIVVSNQSGVARGIVTEEVLGEIHNRLEQLLAEKGVYLDRIYYCPYHPDGVIPKYRKESDWRKPNPGMLLAAAEELDIDLGQSWVIGNSGRDIEAGLRVGCKTILINHSSHYKQPQPGEQKSDYKSVNMKETVNIIKKHHRSSDEVGNSAQPVPAPQTEPALQTTEQPVQQQAVSAEQDTASERTEQLLSSILAQLRSMQRTDMFSEFSTMRLMAGVVQVVAMFCLLTGVWFLMGPTRQDNSVLIALGFAVVFQLMSLTFHIMQRRK